MSVERKIKEQKYEASQFPDDEGKDFSIEKEEKETSRFLDPEKKGGSKALEEKENKSKTKILATIGSLMLCVFLLALNIITAYYLMTEQRNGRGDTKLCINSSLIRLHPEDDLSSFAMYEPNTCCLKEGGNYSQIADKLVERQLKEQLLSESKQYEPLHCDNNGVAVVKMVGKLTNYPDPSSSRFHWLKWDVDIHRSEANMKGNLSYDDRYITVGNTGIYQIYSQVVFQNKKQEAPSSYYESPNKYFLHAIYRHYDSGHDEKILGGSYTYYQNKQGDTTTTSYIGSPYQLRMGDVIGVKVHDVNQVVASSLTNFFGMHLIE